LQSHFHYCLWPRCLFVGPAQNAQPNANRRPPGRTENREQWLRDGRRTVAEAMRLRAQGLRYVEPAVAFARVARFTPPDFISWSGERSRAVAENLHMWLKDVMHKVDPWLSTADISVGARWNVEVARKLEEARFGILCLTKENLREPLITI
jgi:hypothetical protein